jgi:type I restriction enzyme, S subunit
MSWYKAYSEYRNSGVAWLGKTPSTWTLAPLKWFIERNDGGVWGDDPDGENDTLVLRSTEQTVDGFWKMEDPAPRKLSTSDKEFALLRAGDLVVTKSSGSSLHIGKTTIVTDEIERMQCCYSNFMQRIRTSRLLLPKLAWYVMNNELSRAQFDFLSNSTTGLANLNGTMVGQIVLAIPSEVEQKAIINFLDHETAKIDALIEKQQRLIELLKEKRQAVISHTVTKGLNPDSPMKDSGVEWLGGVPAHWDVLAIKHIVSTPITDGPHETPEFFDTGIPFVSAEAVSSGRIDFEKIRAHISDADNQRFSKKYAPKKFDIYMVKSGATTGVTAIVETDDVFNIWSPLAAIRCNELNHPYFVLNFMRSRNFADAIAISWSFGTQQNIGMKVIENLPITRPPLSEAIEIANSLQDKSAKFDKIILQAQAQIELMQERRTALISAAVTGKIDVRDWQAAA